jgi:non-ribosomal peptide synthetase component F
VKDATGTNATEFFDTLLALQYDFPAVDWKSKDVPAPYGIWSTETAVVPLSVLIESADGNLVLRAIYRESHYESSAIEGMLRHLNNVLCAMVAKRNPQQRISDVLDSMVDETERDKIVNSFDRLNEPYIGHNNIKDAFETAAEQFGQLRALESISGSLTYQELDERSNAVASKLMELSPKSRFIPILADGSTEWIIAIIGIIKAGFAYCPIDHKFPRERQRLMAELAEADVMLYPSTIYIPSDPLLDGLRALSVDTIVSKAEGARFQRPKTSAQGNDILCLIFTSGSTGIPKGKDPASVRHRHCFSNSS